MEIYQLSLQNWSQESYIKALKKAAHAHQGQFLASRLDTKIEDYKAFIKSQRSPSVTLRTNKPINKLLGAIARSLIRQF